MEFLKRVRLLDQDVKVILSTGQAAHNLDGLSIQAVLQKPYRKAHALRTIRDVLDG